MTRIRATCPTCGEVDLTSDDLVLCVVGALAAEEPATTYRFACPDCATTVVKPADQRVSRLLAAGGVEVEYASALHLDEELEALVTGLHPELPGDGPPLTRDDLLRFHELLARDDWFDHVAPNL